MHRENIFLVPTKTGINIIMSQFQIQRIEKLTNKIIDF